MRLRASLLLAIGLCISACGRVITPAPPPSPPVVTPPPAAAVRAVGLVVHHQDGRPLAGARCALQDVPGWTAAVTSNDDGYLVWGEVTTGLSNTAVRCSAAGFDDYEAPAILATSTNEDLAPIAMRADVPPLPAAPTRDELLQVRITFQGLYCDTQQFGRLPWFEAALPWLTPEDRAHCYAAKHASPAWGLGGDTHAIIHLPSGAPLYDEPGQPYAADRFGALDWTNGGTKIDPQLGQLVAEVARAGFNRILLFLNGDAGRAGYAIARVQLPLVIDALQHDPAGDLTRYVCIVPGWDGVWHKPGPDGTGWNREDIIAFGQQFRALLPNGCLALEHATGYIPIGEGGGDFVPGGALATYDLILSEFDGPKDAAWRKTLISRDALGRPEYNGTQIWQIAGRLLPTWQRPDDEPGDADGATPPHYLGPGSPRGPYVTCAFEWVGEYLFVRDRETAEQVDVDRAYFQSLGYRCGG